MWLLLSSIARSPLEMPLGASFGTAYKACYGAPLSSHKCVDADGNLTQWPFDKELEVFQHTCDKSEWNPDSVCVMNHFWCGGGWPGYENSRLRYYVDGEEKASVDIPFGLGHGSPYVDVEEPAWSAGALFGRSGQPSGIFNTYPIPFESSVRVTVEVSCHLSHSPSVTALQHYLWPTFYRLFRCSC